MGVHETQFIHVLLFINYCITFYMNNYEPTFAPPCIKQIIELKSLKIFNEIVNEETMKGEC